MTMVQIIKYRLGIKDDSKDIDIEYNIELVKHQIFNYCNIRVLPKMLEHIVVEKVIYLMKQEEDVAQEVKSVSRGDTKTEFASKIVKTSLKSDILGDVKKELAPYRKMAPMRVGDLDQEDGI